MTATVSDRLIRIDDPDDPRIAGFVSIRERDLRRMEGQFIAEGTVVLGHLLAAHARDDGFGAEALLLLENRVDGLSHLLARLPADVPAYVASRTVINAIAGFDMHRGVLALGRRNQKHDMASLLERLPARALIVAAVGISNHDNIGSIFRNAAAFGAGAVLLDATCCDPLYRKSLRVSVGTALHVPYVIGGAAATMLEKLGDAGFAIWGLSPAGKTDIRAVPGSARMALVTGTEGDGLPPDVLSMIRTARIAQAPGIDSLNAATATGIALHALAAGMSLI